MRTTLYDLTRGPNALTASVIDKEWDYFKEWARRFPENDDTHRYGILPIGTESKEENMIFDSDVKNLRIKHLNHVYDNGVDVGHKQRIFINWLERMEGKQ